MVEGTDVASKANKGNIEKKTPLPVNCFRPPRMHLATLRGGQDPPFGNHCGLRCFQPRLHPPQPSARDAMKECASGHKDPLVENTQSGLYLSLSPNTQGGSKKIAGGRTRLAAKAASDSPHVTSSAGHGAF